MKINYIPDVMSDWDCYAAELGNERMKRKREDKERDMERDAIREAYHHKKSKRRKDETRCYDY